MVKDNLSLEQRHAEQKNLSYALLLEQYNISYTSKENVLLCGTVPTNTCWMIHISLVRSEIKEALHKILPVLKSEGAPFSLLKDEQAAENALIGNFGLDAFAKILTVYFADGKWAASIAEQLIKVTIGLHGPEIPTAAKLEGVIYAQYWGDKFKADMWPFSTPLPITIKKTDKLLNNRFMVTSTLFQTVKGDVYKAKYLKWGFWPVTCVIKEGRKDMWMDDQGREMKHRLEWQYRIQQELQDIVNVPKVIDLFYAFGNTFLAMEYIKGESIKRIIELEYEDKTWSELSKVSRQKLLTYLQRIIEVVEKLHSHGYIHRDVTPQNFLLDHKDRLVLIDLELAYSQKAHFPDLPFGVGTKGFCSIQQIERQAPTVYEDIFGLGGLMLNFFTNKFPDAFDFYNTSNLRQQLKPLIQNDDLVNIITECYDPEESGRPDLNRIRTVILNYQKSI